jgi:serine/threonine protein kinase
MMETLPAGTILHGHYRIERPLGSGGFGHVYVGIELRTSQLYAIKEYLVAGASGQAQLEHEARVLSRLHHPNLPVFQEAFNERGRYYVVLSYIEGNDLTDYIRVMRQRNEAVPMTRIAMWILSVCDAVIFLHSQQPFVIHRDIKPDNVRITPNGTAVLVDLGNAKETADGARTLFFIRHQGTPGYAPPEQYPGGSGTDVRSDVYALGGTLFYALTGLEPPSVSTRNQSLQQGQPDLPSLQELLANNPPEQAADPARQFRLGISKPAKPPPRHSRHLAQLGQLPSELLDRLNRIIWRAMALRPKDRYQSVVEFSNDLRSVMAAIPPQPPQKPARPANPYATAPDLPRLYESMQSTKESKEKDQATPGSQTGVSQTAPPAANPVQPSSTILYCPRCNNTLDPQAVYCPRCGLALSSSSKATPPTEPGSKSNNPLPQNKAPTYDISTEQTMIITPPVELQARTPITGGPAMPREFVPRTPASPAAPPTSQGMQHSVSGLPRQPLVLPGTPRQQNTSPGKNNGHTPVLPAVVRTSTQRPESRMPQPSSRNAGFNKRALAIIIVVGIVVMIVLALVLFLASGRPGAQLPARPTKGYLIESQLTFYEQNISLSTALNITPAVVGIRACRASFSSTSGIT